ncbi:MAG: leucine-rich repeat domain-containing protein [Bacteroidales bacterium]
MLSGVASNPLEIGYLREADSGSYRCVVTNSLAPDLTLYSREKRLNLYPSPVSFNIVGQTNVSEYEIVVYSVPANADVDYSWYHAGGNILSYPTDNSIQVQWGSEGTGYLNSYSTNEHGCVSDTATLQINIISQREQDSLALVAFYNSTNGASWINNTNWLSGPISEWYGIEVNYRNRVTGIYLEDNNLTGNISPKLGGLSSLHSLYLHNNQLTGNIPTELRNLLELIELDLSNNQLTGNIPPELGNLSYLRYLYLNGNQLTGSVPLELNNLTKLKKLDLSNCGFDFLPALTHSNLDSLWVGNNNLTFDDIIPNIGVPNAYFSYAPQDSVEITEDIYGCLKSDFSYTISDSHENNGYAWYKDNVLLPDVASNPLEIDYLREADSGSYRCVVTNSLAPDLTLYSREKRLKFYSSPVSFNIVGQTNVSEYEIVVYSVPANADVDYSWYHAGGNIFYYPTANSIQVQWGSEGTGYLNSYSTNEHGCVSDTATLQVNIGPTTGIGDIYVREIKVYPNPTSGAIRIISETAFPNDSMLEIIDSSGKVVKTEPLKDVVSYGTDLSFLPRGVYFIVIRSLGFSQKIVLQ